MELNTSVRWQLKARGSNNLGATVGSLVYPLPQGWYNRWPDVTMLSFQGCSFHEGIWYITNSRGLSRSMDIWIKSPMILLSDQEYVVLAGQTTSSKLILLSDNGPVAVPAGHCVKFWL